MKEELCIHQCEDALYALNNAMLQSANSKLRGDLNHARKIIESVRREEIEIEKRRIELCDRLANLT